MANTSSSFFQVNPCSAHAEGHEFIFRGLYLYHTYSGPSPNQKDIINHRGMGTTVANNWVVRQGFCPNAKIVARAQGLHVNADDWQWHNSFSLVFEDESFEGSTLQVMGLAVEGGQWSIAGGTGQFSMATGVIHKKLHERRSEGNIIELTIQGFRPLHKLSRIPYPIENHVQQVLPIKIGAWGGNGGSAQDITKSPKRLESITIRSGWAIDSIAFTYFDEDGRKHNAGPWGGPGGFSNTIHVTLSEFVKEVSGTFGVFEGYTIVTSLKIATNLRTHGPFGREQGTTFSVPVHGGSSITGFFGHCGQFLDAIGVYVHPELVDLNDS